MISLKDVRAHVGALPLVAKAIGRSLGVAVKFGNGSTACTDYTNIYLPAMPMEPSPGLLRKLWGYLVHEAGHIRFSDPKASAAAKSDGPFISRLRNIFEDVRMERQICQAYPGAHEVLCDLVRELHDTHSWGMPDKEAQPADHVLAHALYWCRHNAGQPGFAGMLSQCDQQVAEVLPKSTLAALQGIYARVPFQTSNWGSLALAREVATLIKEVRDNPPPPEPPQDAPRDAQADDQQDVPQDAQAGDQQGDPQDAQAGDQQGDPQDAQAGDQQDDPQDAQAGDQHSGQGSSPDFAQLAQQVLDAPEFGVGLGDLADMLKPLIDQETSQQPATAYIDPIVAAIAPGGRDDSVIARVDKVSSALRSRLKTLVESVEMSHVRASESGSRLGRRLIPRLAHGDPRVFLREDEVPGTDTAVMVLLDRSGSMNANQRMDTALTATLAVTHALSAIRGVSIAAGVFPGSSSHVEPVQWFGESMRQASARYARVRAHGGTPMAEAMLWGLDALTIRPERRKILLVASDGDPDDGAPIPGLIQGAKRLGIEVWGVGIECTTIRQHFPVSTVIPDVRQLTPSLFALFQEGLFSRRKAA